MRSSPQLLQRASVLSRQGRHELAARELRGYVAQEPDDAAGHALLAVTLTELEEWDEAEASARTAIGHDPELPLAHYALATVLLDRRRYDEAAATAREAIRLDPVDPDFHASLSAIELARRNWGEALEAAEEGLRFDAEHVGCNNLRAMALVRLGRKEEAGATIDGALARDPHDSHSHANMGWTLLERGQRKLAMEHFREALRLDPNNAWARSGLVEAIKAGNPIYAFMLRWFLWTDKLSGRAVWTIILGGYFGYRGLRVLARDPAWAPWVTPLIVLYVAFVLLTWLASPLFDLALFLHPMGKHALDDDQRVRAKLVGSALGVALVAAALHVLAPVDLELDLLAIVAGLLSIPLSAIHMCAEGRPRRIMAVIAAGLVALGATAWAVGGLVRPAEESAMEALGLAALVFFLLGILVSQFAANALVRKEPAR